ncbi:hypothetical protein [Olleya sp. YS]|uniref:hypothetical protein n=1 Tax=Olleya sp. YS TaxID=3028318 RepID=UPI002434159D|nr:hypothetical protein [Olleya sp. YS]WGD35062.1 hypothetical protein Ollyesu_01280 [Olleya sp. YS]
MNSKKIFEKIESVVEESVTTVVVPFNYFYGRLDNEVWDWLEEKFPNKGIARESEN